MNGAASCHTAEPRHKSVYQFSQTLRDGKHRLLTFAYFLIAFIALCVSTTSSNELLHLSLSWCCSIAIFSTLLGLPKLFQVSEESILLISPLGIQITTAYVTGKPHTKFIPWCAIRDVVINEAVSGFRMIHYLAVLVNDDSGKQKLVPILLNSQLRLQKLKEIYCDVQKVLKS